MLETDQPFTTRRERRIAARKDQILDVATRLFSEKGFDHATTREIAAAADVSEGTLYNYFETKDHMLLGIMSRLGESQQLGARLTDSLPLDAREFLCAMLCLRKEFIAEHVAMLRTVLSEILVHPDLRQRYYQQLAIPAIELLEAHLQARRDLGQIRDVDIPLAARMLVGLTTGLFFLDILEDPLVQNHWDELTQVITSIFFDGIAPLPNS